VEKPVAAVIHALPAAAVLNISLPALASCRWERVLFGNVYGKFSRKAPRGLISGVKQEIIVRWTDIDQQVCSVARALSVVGERWTLLILRDAFLGTRRFDQFQSNLGITRHRLSERLTKLVEQGVLVKVPYHDKPLRHEYRLTRKGLALYPVLMSLARWGDDWMAGDAGAPLEYVHEKCGHKARPVLTCSECGDPLRPEEVKPQLGPALLELLAPGDVPGEDKSIPALIRQAM
jgi:DNA-binding HxlR family transcriptional regulator